MLNNAMSVVILAAGKGTRMYSDLPKVLHTLAGKPMVQHVIDAANELGATHVHLVYGHGGDLLKQTLKDGNLNWVLQAEQLGTGHAMQQAAPFFGDDEDILMLYGDVPLISVETLQRLRDAKLRLADAEAALVDKTKAAARATDDFVNDNPWQAVGIAAGIGLLLGIIIGRR